MKQLELPGVQDQAQTAIARNTILGSVLGSSAARMTLDYKEEIGYRTVERLVMFGKTDEGDEYDKAKSFPFLISGCRQRPTKVRFRLRGTL